MPNIADLLSHGIALVPIPAGQKGPASKGWNEKRNAVTDITHLALLKGLNIGIAHAYCTPSPSCAIDLDDYQSSKVWFSVKGIDLDAILRATDAVVIHSGKRNSLKLLYRLPLGINPLPSKVVKSPTNKMMIEFRCASAEGLTVQDVLPPSMHPSGTKYRFIGAGSILALPVIPTSLIEVWSEMINANKISNNTLTIRSVTPETPREIARVQAMLTHISADCSYFTYRDVIWSILSTGWTCAESLAKDWCQSAPYRFDDANFMNVVKSFSLNVPRPISLGTLHHLAKVGGWND